MSEMNKCRHCGIFVPVEKAFCPNCSEPIEPEEAPNRAASFTSEMMTTLRDDPENYREMLADLKKPSATAEENNVTSAPGPVSATPPVVGYNASEAAHGATSPPAKTNRRNLVLGIGVVSVLILLFVILLTLRVF